jgi:glutaredoxin
VSVRLLARVILWVSLALAIAGGAACRRSHGAPTAASDPGEASIVVKDDSEGLLLTWIDDKGDFNVVMRTADVPLMGRDAVRVSDPNKDETGHPDRVFVVDLRQARPDGTYPVRTMSRVDFEAIAVARREKTGPTLAGTGPPAAGPPSAEPSGEPGAAPPGGAAVAGRATVIIYGAEWCGACHDAARYLRQKGVAYVEKDVEKDPAAAREMQAKLAKNGLRAGSIPVIDVRGHVMIGFNAAQIDGALGQAL